MSRYARSRGTKRPVPDGHPARVFNFPKWLFLLDKYYNIR